MNPRRQVTACSDAGAQAKMLEPIAFASKMARRIWVMLTQQEDYREQTLAAA